MVILAIHLGLVWNLTTRTKSLEFSAYFRFGAAASHGPQHR